MNVQHMIGRDLVTVPDLSAAKLVEVAKSTLGLTYVDPGLKSWDFMRDERGRSYETVVLKPGGPVMPDKVRSDFDEQGFTGNAAAFIAWVLKKNPVDYHASILDERRCLRGELHNAFVPYYFRDGDPCGFGLCNLSLFSWHDRWSFVAFREVR